jgi:hypothetical protein
MTDITPPLELVSKWCYEDGEEIKSSPRWFVAVCAKAAQWGADQELEAIQKEIITQAWFADPRHRLAQLRAARRPKPPSLKAQAYAALDTYIYGNPDHGDKQNAYNTIRRALEQLDD